MRPDFVYSRTYQGKVKGLILDWSGTVADAYVIAPAVVFVDVFAKHGVEITMEEARGAHGFKERPAYRATDKKSGHSRAMAQSQGCGPYTIRC